MERSILLLAVVLMMFGCGVHCDKVPAFLWTTNRDADFPEVYAGHTIMEQEFLEDFLHEMIPDKEKLASDENVKPRTLAVFLQQEMSLQELTRRAEVFNSTVKGSVFASLRNIMATTNSKFLPAVYSAYESLMSLIRGGADDDDDQKKNPIVQIIDIFHPFENSGNYIRDKVSGLQTVYILHIPSTASPREIDDLIGTVDKELMSQGLPYSAIYTAKRSPDHRIEKPDVLILKDFNQNGVKKDISTSEGATRRKLQSQTIYYPTYYMFVNLTNCLYLYAQNVTLSVLGQGTWSLPLDAQNPSVDDTSFCANNSAELSLTFTDIDNNLKEVNFLMIFGVTQNLNAGYWLMTNFTVTYMIYNSTMSAWYNETTEMYPYFITETPYGFSYSCYELPPISPLHTMDGLGTKTVNVTFSALQVQVFNITNYQFGYYNDCVGFFTITTWAILIVLFIMVGILAFAACMFAGLSTPDRYEDAHSKQLVINTVD